jgi:drug/metabolite transporter (DMT)-like permease
MHPQLSPVRDLRPRRVAGVLSVVYLLLTRSPLPRGRQWRALGFTACCVVVGFPLFLALGLRHVESVHAAVVTGILPLVTAVVASLWLRQRPSTGFWVCAVAGSALVAAFMVLRAGRPGLRRAVGRHVPADRHASAACGYVSGGQLTTAKLGAERVICWVLVISLPLTLPVMAVRNWPRNRLPPAPGGLCLCRAVLDVDRLLCLVPRAWRWAARCA